MTDLTVNEIHALNEALDDEAAPPFSNIRDAEARHIEVMHTLYTLKGLRHD